MTAGEFNESADIGVPAGSEIPLEAPVVAPYPEMTGGMADFDPATVSCPQCGNPMFQDQFACTACGQVQLLPLGTVLTPAARRLGQYLLEILLAIVTLVIGWIIWSLIVWGRGQTPAMQVLHIRAVKSSDGQTATWGTMFLREFVAKGLLMGIVSAVFFPAWIVLAFMLLWDKQRQEVWDKIAGTLVVNNLPTESATADGTAVAPAPLG